MQTLYNRLPRSVHVEGKKYRLNLSYDVVLTCLDIQQDQAVPDYLKIPFMAEKLIRHGTKLPIELQAKIVAAVFKDCIYCTARKGKPSQTKTFDFKCDTDLIYASFCQAYGIDLIKKQGRLHWWKFYSLFAGLPKDTIMREVMSIRAREIPQPTKYNHAEIMALQEAKQYWALPGAALNAQSYQDGLQSLWTTLERQAQKHV